MTLGVDVADIARVRALLARYPCAQERLFTAAERDYCLRFADPMPRFAGTFAAKEAVVKALGLRPPLAWLRRVEITRDEDGRPWARIVGTVVCLSISHDAGIATAVALEEPVSETVAGHALVPGGECVPGSDFP